MKDLNKVQLTGHVGQDPEVRHTENGHVLTRFSVASNRRWNDQDGAVQEETEWVNAVAWDKLAEICGDYLRKGSHIYLEGRLHTRTYDDPDSGQKRYFTEVIASELIMLDRRADSEDGTDEDAPVPATTRTRAAVRQEERRAQPAEHTSERRRTRTRAHPADVL